MRWFAALVGLAACRRVHPARVQIEVDAAWPGRSGDAMATLVATPLEHELAELPHVREVTSVSREGKTVVRVALDGEPEQSWMIVQEAIGRSTARLPLDLPAPPEVESPGVVIGRYLVSRDTLGEEREAIRRHVDSSVETCGAAGTQQELVLDPRMLANMGVTVPDVVAAIRMARTTAFSSIEIMRRNGNVVHVSDIGGLRDAQSPGCMLVTPMRGQVELIVHAEPPRRDLDIHGIAVPTGPELHGELDPALEPGATVDRIAQAIGSDAAVAEIRGDQLVVRGATSQVEQRLRKTPGVLRIGAPTGTVHVSGADAQQVAEVARAISERLRAADQLVATHGLATATTRLFDIDRDRATSLGVATDAITETLAATRGLVVTTMSTHADSMPLVVRVDGAADLLVRARGDAEVPLSSLVRVSEAPARLEVLHRGLLPDVDLEVHGDPHAAIGAVPPGVRVDVDVGLGVGVD